MVDHLFADPDLAALYEQLTRGRSDFDFHLPMVISSASVLDSGCGTGELRHRAREAGQPDGCAGSTTRHKE